MHLLIALLPMFVSSATPRYAIIDVHLHAEPIDSYGPPPVTVCAPYDEFPARDPSKPIADYVDRMFGHPDCAHKVLSSATQDALLTETVAQLEKHNMLAVVSGEEERVTTWVGAAKGRMLPAIGNMDTLPSIDALRAAHKAGHLKVLGEITAQYSGFAPNDPSLEPYFALAEELDVPVAIHVGPAPPGAAYFAAPKYRMAHSHAMLLEEVLLRHPKLRLYVMHAGWPFADDMIALLYAHPQVYVDTGIIDFAYPRAHFHAYLKRLVEAGFGKRIMYGSDQMIWPASIDTSISSIRSAPFLSEAQKRGILHDNAARFLRIDG